MKNFVPIFLLITIISCNQKDTSKAKTKTTGKDPKPDMAKMQWLVGTWKGKADTTVFYEAWRKGNDSLLMNYGLEVKPGDTSISGDTPFGYYEGNIVLSGADSTGWSLYSVSPARIILKSNKPDYDETITWEHTNEDHWLTTIKNPGKTVTYDLQRDVELDQWVTEKLRKN